MPYLKHYNIKLHEIASSTIQTRLNRATNKNDNFAKSHEFLKLKENKREKDLMSDNVPFDEFIKNVGETYHKRNSSKPVTPFIDKDIQINDDNQKNPKIIINNFLSTKENKIGDKNSKKHEESFENFFDQQKEINNQKPSKLFDGKMNDNLKKQNTAEETKNQNAKNEEFNEKNEKEKIDINLKIDKGNLEEKIENKEVKDEIAENKEKENKNDNGKENTVNNADEPEIIESLPNLKNILSTNTLLSEFANIELSNCEFFLRNLRRRHIVVSSFMENSILYSRSKRIGNFIVQCEIMMFIITILYTLNLSNLNFVNKSILN